MTCCIMMLVLLNVISVTHAPPSTECSVLKKMVMVCLWPDCGEWDLSPMVPTTSCVQSNSGRRVVTETRGFYGVFSPDDLFFGSDTEHESGCYVEVLFVSILLTTWLSIRCSFWSGMPSQYVSYETISVAVNYAFVQILLVWSVCPFSQYSDPFSHGYPTATATARPTELIPLSQFDAM